jgi:hypothetical protein
LGITGAVIVTLCAIVGCVSTWMFGTTLGELIIASGLNTTDVQEIVFANQAELNATLMPSMLASVVGVAGLVLSIVAVVKKNGRPWGIFGIILGVLAPLAMFGFYFASMMAVVSAYIQ